MKPGAVLTRQRKYSNSLQNAKKCTRIKARSTLVLDRPFCKQKEQQLMTCPACKGTGKVTEKEDCPACDGTGEINITDDYGQKRKIKCFTCRGTGKIKDEDTCPMCGGAGEV